MTIKRGVQSLLAAGLMIAAAANAAAPTQFSSAAGEIRDFVAISASVGYAGTYGGGLWKSSDSGANWSKTALPAKIVWKISANAASGGARLYAATDSGLYRSLDSGASWTQLTQDATRAVAVSPGSGAGGPDTVLFGVTGAGVYRTTDSGATFARVSFGLDSTDVTGLVFASGSSTVAFALLQCNVENLPTLSGSWGGAFRTTNANAATPAWNVVNAGLPAPAVVATGMGTAPCLSSIAANASTVLVGVKDPNTNQGLTYFLTGANVSSGSTWTTSASNIFGVEWLGPDLSNASGFFMGSNQFGPHRSTDNGNTFASVTNGTQDPDFVTQSFAAGAFTSTVWVAGVAGIGLFRTTNAGGLPGFVLPATPVRADRVNDLANHNTALPALYYMAIERGGVMKSTDSGATWVEFDSGLQTDSNGTNGNFVRNVQTIAAHPGNGSVVLLGVRTAGLYQLSGGTSWARVTGYSNANDHKPQSMAMTPGGRVLVSLFDAPYAPPALPGGLHQSVATGTTIGTLASDGVPLYDDANPGLGIAPGAGRIRLSPSTPDARMFLMVNDSLPYLSTNGGANWTRVITSDGGGFQRHSFNDLAEKPASTSIVVGATNKGIFRSIDGGAHFSRVNATGLQQHNLAAVVYASNNVIFGGDVGGQLYCSADDGVNWLAVTGGNLGSSIRDMKNINGAVHVLTDGGGIWKKDGVCP